MEQRHGRKQQVGVACLRVLGTALALSAAGAGCAVPPQQAASPVARPGSEDRPMQLLNPMEYVSPRDAIVRVVGAGNVTCTGTLFADDRVLTAHHCVSARDKKGRVLNRDMAPEDIQIELGGDFLPWGEARVRAIVAPQCGYAAGEGDIAILVLERHLIGMPTSSARLEAAPELSDNVSIFGFGRCALSPDGIQRRARGDGDTKIESIGPGQFEARAPICPGDSGGPVYSSKTDLVGVVSATIMHADEKTKERTIFTRLDAWRNLFAAAHEISNGASPSELPPYGECSSSPPRPPSRPAR